MPPRVRTDIKFDRKSFAAMMTDLPSEAVVVAKIGAEWCRPCREIARYVDMHMYNLNLPPNVFIYIIDFDLSDDLFSYLSSRKVITGIPALLMYTASDVPIAPSDVYCGTDETAIDNFFATVLRTAMDPDRFSATST